MKKILFIVLCLALSFFFNSCSGERQSLKRGDEIVVAFWGIPPEKEMRTKVIELFKERNPDVKVRIEYTPGQEYFAKIMLQIAGNTLPDVFYTGADHAWECYERGALLDLKPFIDKDTEYKISDYFPNLTKVYQYKDAIYGLPVEWSPFIIYYNKDMFDKQGLKYPWTGWTWDDFLTAARKLTIKDEKGRIIQYGFMSYLPFYVWIAQAGGEIFNSDYTKCIINSESAVRAVRFLHDMTHKYRVTPSYKEDFIEASQLFLNKKIAMFITGIWEAPGFKNIKDFKWNIGPLPRGKRNLNLLYNHCVVVSKKTKNPENAWRLAKFIASKDAQEFVLKNGGKIPAYRALVESERFLNNPEYPGQNNKVLLDSVKEILPEFRVKGVANKEILDIIRFDIEKILYKSDVADTEIKQTLDTIAMKINQLIKK